MIINESVSCFRSKRRIGALQASEIHAKHSNSLQPRSEEISRFLLILPIRIGSSSLLLSEVLQ